MCLCLCSSVFDVLSHDVAELVDCGDGGIAHQRDMDRETCCEAYFDCYYCCR